MLIALVMDCISQRFAIVAGFENSAKNTYLGRYSFLIKRYIVIVSGEESSFVPAWAKQLVLALVYHCSSGPMSGLQPCSLVLSPLGVSEGLMSHWR